MGNLERKGIPRNGVHMLISSQDWETSTNE